MEIENPNQFEEPFPDSNECTHCGAVRSPAWFTDVNDNIFCSGKCMSYHLQAKSEKRYWNR